MMVCRMMVFRSEGFFGVGGRQSGIKGAELGFADDGLSDDGFSE